jgi:hypothetical protein
MLQKLDRDVPYARDEDPAWLRGGVRYAARPRQCAPDKQGERQDRPRRGGHSRIVSANQASGGRNAGRRGRPHGEGTAPTGAPAPMTQGTKVIGSGSASVSSQQGSSPGREDDVISSWPKDAATRSVACTGAASAADDVGTTGIANEADPSSTRMQRIAVRAKHTPYRTRSNMRKSNVMPRTLTDPSANRQSTNTEIANIMPRALSQFSVVPAGHVRPCLPDSLHDAKIGATGLIVPILDAVA